MKKYIYVLLHKKMVDEYGYKQHTVEMLGAYKTKQAIFKDYRIKAKEISKSYREERKNHPVHKMRDDKIGTFCIETSWSIEMLTIEKVEIKEN